MPLSQTGFFSLGPEIPEKRDFWSLKPWVSIHISKLPTGPPDQERKFCLEESDLSLFQKTPRNFAQTGFEPVYRVVVPKPVFNRFETGWAASAMYWMD